MVIWLGQWRSFRSAQLNRSYRELRRLDSCLLRDLAISEAEIDWLLAESREREGSAVRYPPAIQFPADCGIWNLGGFVRRGSHVATAK
jgi:uncharacterized protein YjiS (DUF1127 family)